MSSIGSLCTIITTTSPTPSPLFARSKPRIMLRNPSLELIGSTIESLEDFAPELLACRHIVVCDGYKRSGCSRFRSGVVSEERAAAYERYMERLELMALEGPRAWKMVEVLRLQERQGFGFAVKSALELVTTPFVAW